MLRKLIFAAMLSALVCLPQSESQARGRSRGSSSMIRRMMQRMQQNAQAYQKQMLQQQQLMMQQQAAMIQKRREALQAKQQKDAESRERRKETLQQLRSEQGGRTVDPPKVRAEEMLKNYDKNQDKSLTKAEVEKNPLSLHFAEGDVNQDGKLTLKELTDMLDPNAQKAKASKKAAPKQSPITKPK